MTEPVVEAAPAKLNVFLRVLDARDDGYHAIETLILPLDLYDVVTVEPAEALEIVVDGPRTEELRAAGGEGLVARALEAIGAVIGPEATAIRVTVDKRIPVAAGLGGGSADAAAVLRVLGRIHGLEGERLHAIAAAVGSDVPGLLQGGAVFATGRGDRVLPVHAPPTVWVMKAFATAIKSEDAYAWWDEDGTTGPDPGALIAAVETGNLELLGSALYDDLQPGVERRHPEVAGTIGTFLDAGALGAIMSGSGPTVVALARHLVHADALARVVPGSIVVSGPPG